MVARELTPKAAEAASKAAVATATKTLALELGRFGIRVNGIHPGHIWGPSVKWYFDYLAEQRGVTPQEVYDEIGESLPGDQEFPKPGALADQAAEITATGLFNPVVDDQPLDVGHGDAHRGEHVGRGAVGRMEQP